MAPARPGLATILGEHWRQGVRRFDPDHLVGAGVLLARNARPPRQAKIDATVWPEARRQRMEAILRQLSVSGDLRPSMSPHDWAGLLWATAQCRSVVPDELCTSAVAAVTASGAPVRLEPSDTARIFWAAATLQWVEHRLLDCLSEEAAAAKFADFSARDLSNIMWASATVRYRKDGWAAEVAGAFARDEKPRAPQAVANVLWGLSKMHGESPLQGPSLSDGLVLQLAQAAIPTLQQASAQHVANMLSAFAKLQVSDESVVHDVSRRMALLLAVATPQNVAGAAWSVARLGLACEHLMGAIDAHLHERIEGGPKGWRRRWSECSPQHVSMLSWAFAKAAPTHPSTRRVLRDVVDQLEDGFEACLAAQEHANILWAFAEASGARASSDPAPRVLHGRLVRMLCDPALRLEKETPLSAVSAAHSLSELRSTLETSDQLILRRWMKRISQRCCELGLSRLSASELVTLLRSMMACRTLHPRLTRLALKELQGDRAMLLRGFELSRVMDATWLLRAPIVPREFLDILSCVVPRLGDFQPRELVAILQSLGPIGAGARPQEIQAFLVAVTASLTKHNLAFPLDALHASPEHGSLFDHGSASDVATSDAGTHSVPHVRLTAQDWALVTSAAEPVRVTSANPVAPEYLLKTLVQPWMEWFEPFVVALARETSLLSSSRLRSADVQKSALHRYRAAIQRDGVSNVGPRWTATALQRLGVHYLGSDVPPSVSKAVEARRLALSRTARHFGVVACLQVDVKEVQGSALREEWCAWSSGGALRVADDNEATDDKQVSSESQRVPDDSEAADDNQTTSSSQLLAAPFGKASRSKHSEFQLLARLDAELSASGGSWTGRVLLFVDRTPCLSCAGALGQFRCLWPNVEVRVAYSGGPADPQEASEVHPPSEVPRPAAKLEEAVVRFLRARDRKANRAPVALVGTVPEVRDLWPLVRGTTFQGKRAGKKRDWQDKLRYFLSHRPDILQVEAEEDVWYARLTSGRSIDGQKIPAADGSASERVENFNILTDVVNHAIAELLGAGKGLRGDGDDDGYVLIEVLGSLPAVQQAWLKCRSDRFDRLGFFLRHSDDFEVCVDAHSEESGSSSGSRSRVRPKL